MTPSERSPVSGAMTSAERMSLFIFLILSATYISLAAFYPYGYLLGTYENLPGEWLQFVLFGATSVVAFCNAGRHRQHAAFHTLLAVACLFVAMEEISWGQQIFQWASPDAFRAHNLQGETNLHNVFTGPVRTPVKTALEFLVCAAIAGYGVVLPLLALRFPRFGSRLSRFGVVTPPLATLPFFAAAAWLELSPFGFNEAEVAELMLGCGLLITALHHRTLTTSATAATRLTDKMCRAQSVAFPAVLILSLLATGFVHVGDDNRRRSRLRIEHGMEKFADRLARDERFDPALDLYGRLRDPGAERPSVLRRIARIHRQRNEPGPAHAMLQTALDYDLERLQRDPGSVPAHRSICRSYRQMGKAGPASHHLSAALTLGLKRVRNEPGSAAAAYSLGSTYRLSGNSALASLEFGRAAELDPLSAKYRRVYLSSR